MPFTPEEKERIAYHLSYPNVGQHDALRSMGVSIAAPIVNELETAITSVKPSSEYLIREQVKRLDCVRKSIDEARSQIIILAVDTTRFNGDAIHLLWGEYNKERGVLADQLGINKYPFSYQTTRESGPAVVEPW